MFFSVSHFHSSLVVPTKVGAYQSGAPFEKLYSKVAYYPRLQMIDKGQSDLQCKTLLVITARQAQNRMKCLDKKIPD